MQKYKHIKALFFLGIFSVLLLHQIVPHLHHHHDVEHTHDAISHIDAHHHDHDVPEKENSEKGFFDFFLEMHVHSVVFNEIQLINQNSIKHLDHKKDSSESISFYQYAISIYSDEAEKIKDYHPPNNYFNSYLSSLDSRGPPSLG